MPCGAIEYSSSVLWLENVDGNVATPSLTPTTDDSARGWSNANMVTRVLVNAPRRGLNQKSHAPIARRERSWSLPCWCVLV